MVRSSTLRVERVSPSGDTPSDLHFSKAVMGSIGLSMLRGSLKTGPFGSGGVWPASPSSSSSSSGVAAPTAPLAAAMTLPPLADVTVNADAGRVSPATTTSSNLSERHIEHPFPVVWRRPGSYAPAAALPGHFAADIRLGTSPTGRGRRLRARV